MSVMFDVEMVGRTGHCCHVFIVAENENQAAKLAQDYFTELELTGNTRVDRSVPEEAMEISTGLSSRYGIGYASRGD